MTETPEERSAREEREKGQRRFFDGMLGVVMGMAIALPMYAELFTPRTARQLGLLMSVVLVIVVIPATTFIEFRRRWRKGEPLFPEVETAGPNHWWNRMRRSPIFKWVMLYVVFVWVAVSTVVEFGSAYWSWPDTTARTLDVLLIVGVPIVAATAWYYSRDAEIGPVTFWKILVLVMVGGMSCTLLLVLWDYIGPGRVMQSGMTVAAGAAVGIQRVLRARGRAVVEQKITMGNPTFLYTWNYLLLGSVLSLLSVSMTLMMYFEQPEGFAGNTGVSLLTAVCLLVLSSGYLMRVFIADGDPTGPLLFVVLVILPVMALEAGYYSYRILPGMPALGFTALRGSAVLLGSLVYWGLDRRATRAAAEDAGDPPELTNLRWR